MRQTILDILKALSLGTFSVSDELPWSSSGVPLYVKNFKKIYVDQPQIITEEVIATLDGISINNEITTVRVYFTTDAKLLPNNYDTLVSAIRTEKDNSDFAGYTKRECDITTSFEADAMVTQFEFRFTKII